MSRLPTSPFQPKLSQKAEPYYIVENDFITNLRKGRKYRTKTQDLEQRQPSFIRQSCVIVNKKNEILGKLPMKSNNDFYELDKQIKNNSRTLYRKMTVALRKERMGYNGRLSNPFTREVSQPKYTRRFDQEKNLSDLIYYVQPYWIKKYISKTPMDGR